MPSEQIKQYQQLIRYEHYRLDEKLAGRIPEDFESFLEWEGNHGLYPLPDGSDSEQVLWHLSQMPVAVLLDITKCRG